MQGKIDCAGLTDPGRVRPENEDQFLIASLSKSMQVHQTSLGLDEQTRLFGASQGRLLLVADGVGGHAAGRRASALAVDSLTAYILNTMQWFFRLRQDSEDQFLDDLKAALGYCQERVNAEGERFTERRGMGTTLTMAYLCWPRMYVVHAGDSRCYLLRGGRLKQITHDHTIAQQLVEVGAIKDPDGSPWSHVLWNVVGGGSGELTPEVDRADLTLGDSVLLCSDGLSKHVGDADIARLLGASHPSTETCRHLVDAANSAGGTDNITVVVAHFRDAKSQQTARQAAEQVPATASA
ncbi:MAG TPA: protein phosphatase 2C domain-containing protein [Gemmataceae bacterium]|nr:protein phosphatase 2C domain-containing protein [Gemmataceae bacterium]